MSKKIKIFLILYIFIIAILIGASLYNVFATVSLDISETGFHSNEDLFRETLAYATNSYAVSEEYYINEYVFVLADSKTQMEENWWVLCCQKGAEIEDGVKIKWTNLGTYIANPAEAYTLSTIEYTNEGEYATIGQMCWWKTYLGHVKWGGSGGSVEENILFESGRDFQYYIGEVLGIGHIEIDATFNWTSYYTTFTIDGITVQAPDIDDLMNPDFVEDVDGDGLTYSEDGDEDDKVTKKYRESDQVWVIGPFMLDYIERYSGDIEAGYYSYDLTSSDYAYAESLASSLSNKGVTTGNVIELLQAYLCYSGYIDESSAIVYAGLCDTYLKTNSDEILVYGEDWWFEYVDEADIEENDGQSRVTGYPSTGKEFQICILADAAITKVFNLCFEYKYMNAGGQVVAYSGTARTCAACGALLDYDYDELSPTIDDIWDAVVEYDDFGNYCHLGGAEGTCWEYVWVTETETRYGKHEVELDDGSIVIEDGAYEVEVQVKKIKSLNTSFPKTEIQTLASVEKAVKWYTYKTFEITFEIPTYSTLKIEKTIVDSNGEKLELDGTFIFNVYIDYGNGEGEMLIPVKVDVTDGYGYYIISDILWYTDEDGNAVAPTYRIEEQETEGFVSYDGVTTWSGTLLEDSTVTISAKNKKERYEGRLQIQKSLLNVDDDDPQVDATFTFTVTLTGTFAVGDGDIAEYTDADPYTVTLTISNEGTATTEYFTWYDEDNPPNYVVVEEETEESKDYQLAGTNGASGVILGTLQDGDTTTIDTVAIFTNEPVSKTKICLDKVLLNDDDSVSGSFNVTITITLDDDEETLRYGGTEVTSPYEISTTVSIGETWQSEEISWTGGTAPTYTVTEEEDEDDDFYYVSTTDENESTTDNDFESTLVEGYTYVTLTNKTVEDVSGTIKIVKYSDTDELEDGEEFNYTLTITYPGDSEDEESTTEYTGTIAVGGEGDEYPISWKEDEEVPTYTVEEEITEDQKNKGISFVSISNNEECVTSEPKISGSLIQDDTVVVEIINTKESEPEVPDGGGDLTGGVKNAGKIRVEKEVTDDSLSGETFNITVEITGTFTYNDIEYKNETLTIDGTVTDSDPWISEYIYWENDVTAPTYKVTEVIEESDDYTLVSWRNETYTVQTSSISGTVRYYYQDRRIHW